jgi:hypothetical protein
MSQPLSASLVGRIQGNINEALHNDTTAKALEVELPQITQNEMKITFVHSQ